MKKAKAIFICQECQAVFPKWNGQCFQCQAYNTLEQKLSTPATRQEHYAGVDAKVIPYNDIELEHVKRFSSHNPEFDRVLGGGFVPGAVMVLSGDPGVGKSTLTLQTLHTISQERKTLYLSG